MANPRAVAAGLGDCLRGKGLAAAEQGGRPYHHMTGYLDDAGRRRQFRALAYHVVWCDENDSPPPAAAGLFYSHLCHNSRCVEARHGVWETMTENRERARCVEDGGALCTHTPACVPFPLAT
jgi:hypothetical protein